MEGLRRSSIRVALAGNPNSGKTTLFNALTGRFEHVGNWAGVTIDKKEGEVRKSLNNTNVQITIVDLPGAYSMSPLHPRKALQVIMLKTKNPMSSLILLVLQT